MNAAPLRRCCSREGVERPRTLGTVRATGANDLAVGEVKRWEKATHREEITYYETHCFSRLAMALISAACGANASGAPGSAVERDPTRPNHMKIRLSVEGKELTATLIDSQTSRDFIAL